ncbi:hypothetical protein LOK49_LG01G04136 [Camellia lanceoleosa]|uniref:Uncharacterized protein n=1 Tax=Camellia lanceoleosa TaxID=1840588 RepID=A0ACC0J0B9_9ERIC|nr:hypothetical protein LOK49_LG01G04136 [Camellia lanceoleosa]
MREERSEWTRSRRSMASFSIDLRSQYFLCEHTTLVVADRPGVFPRFLKWNVGTLLARMRSVTLDDVDKFEVLPSRLQVSKYEMDQLLSGNDVVDGSDDDFVDKIDMIDNVHRDEKTIDARKLVMNVIPRGAPSRMPSVTATLEDAHRTIFVLQSENKSKDFVIAKLEEQVSKLTSALEQQASNMFVGFNSCLKVKDDEIARMAGARRADAKDETDSFAFVDAKNVKELIHDVTQMAVGRDSVETRNRMDIGSTREKAIKASVGSALQNSFVKKIKEKVRQERKLPEFEYPMVRGHLCRVDESEGQRVVSDGGINFNIDLCDEVEVVNEVDGHNKKRSGYGLNNRFAIWKLVKEGVKHKISTTYERDGDE